MSRSWLSRRLRLGLCDEKRSVSSLNGSSLPLRERRFPSSLVCGKDRAFQSAGTLSRLECAYSTYVLTVFETYQADRGLATSHVKTVSGFWL